MRNSDQTNDDRIIAYVHHFHVDPPHIEAIAGQVNEAVLLAEANEDL